MRIDPLLHESQVIVTADRRIGIWGSQTFSPVFGKSIRNAGQLPTEASAHTLLLVAVMNSLRGITRRQATKMADLAPRGVLLPRVQVLTNDDSFANALRGFQKVDSAAHKPLRAGRNIIDFARRQFTRFTLDVQVQNSEDRYVEALLDWAKNQVINPELIRRVPLSLRPSAVGTIV